MDKVNQNTNNPNDCDKIITTPDNGIVRTYSGDCPSNSDKYVSFLNKYGDEVTDIYKQPESKAAVCDIKIDREVNMRIIGYAGVGKSSYINKNFSYHDYLLLAFTGIAASQINGTTLSSTFKLGRFNENSVDKAVSSMKFMYKLKVEQIRLAKGLVIDEFYTTPADIMHKVNIICQKLRNCTDNFGGLQLIVVGDDRQTQCVSDAFVDSDLYKSMEFKDIILPEHPLMRLTPKYMKYCNAFRDPRLNRNKILRLLSNNKFAQKKVDGYSVYYTNAEVNNRNNIEIVKFEGEIIYKNFKKNMPIYITSSWGSLCNGVMGILLDKKENFLEIEVDGKTYEIETNKINFVPGFAITIHKCQSKTWDGINIYIKKSDVLADRAKYIRLIYVALTRVRHFDKCHISLY